MMRKDVARITPLLKAIFWMACFALPIALFAIVCAWNGVYPFGAESFLTEDTKYQYVDLFTWFRRVLLGETSAFYLENTGMGTNAWGLVSYYLSSPFNVAVLAFDEDHMTDFFWFITAMKLGCIQVSATWYLLKRFEVSRPVALALALSFTWSSWTATQMRNPLWLDALILLPLVAYSVFLLIRDERWVPLAITLAIAIITCWYTAYMIILFMSLFAILELVCALSQGPGISGKGVVKRVALYILALAVALALSAFTFVPTVAAMLGGSKGLDFDGVFMTDFNGIAGSFFLGNWTVNVAPQHFAGTLVTLLAMAFVFSRGIPMRVKAVAIALVVVMVASSCLSPLLYIWSGFRRPAGFYCRITFLTIFLAVWMAAYVCRGTARTFELDRRAVVIGSAVVALAAIAVFAGGMFVRSSYALATVLLIVVYAVLLLACDRWRESVARIVASAGLCAFVFSELLYGAHVNWSQLYVGYPQEYHDGYVSEARAQAQEIEALDGGVYRCDKTYTRADYSALNEGAARGYRALSSYASSQDIAAINMLNGLGYSHKDAFSMRYATSILVTDTLFGVKYVSAETCPAGFVDPGLMSVSGSSRIQGARFYVNPYALPLGYGVSDDAVALSLDSDMNPFERQNALVSSFLGEDVELYRPIDATVTEETEGWRTYLANVPAHAIGYAYIDSPGNEPLWLLIDDEEPVLEDWYWRHAINAIGDEQEEPAVHEVTLSTGARLEDAQIPFPDEAKCLLYYLDMERFSDVVGRLSDASCEFEAFESGHIEASCQVGSDGYVAITIPDTKGWSLLVNGKPEVTRSACDGGIMLVPVTAGANEIVLNFTPPGLFVGCAVSALALLALIALIVMSRLRRPAHSSSLVSRAK